MHGLKAEEIRGQEDLQSAAIFPVVKSVEELGQVLRWMLDAGSEAKGKEIWQQAEKVSADEISHSEI